MHYMVDQGLRWNVPEVIQLIDERRYALLHAPRQTGKTSCLLHLRDQLNAEGRYAAVYCNIEVGQALRNDVEAAMLAIGGALMEVFDQTLGLFSTFDEQRALSALRGSAASVHTVLSQAAKRLYPRPLVVFFDEVDALVGDTLVSFLRQIRAGYAERPQAFPQSVFLCGLRDIADYRITTSDKEIVTGGSAFNIKAESLLLGDFTPPMVEGLLDQHTEATGQIFEFAAREAMWFLTQGQPWLVNALADQCVRKLATDAAQPITLELVHQAKERLIVGRVTHLDQLHHKLGEPRVRSVIEPILAGDDVADIPLDDQLYVRDMGLIKKAKERGWDISNPIYREVIPRELNATAQINVEAHGASIQPGWLRADGSMDFAGLMERFVEFWREHGEALMRSVPYHEVSAQLSLMAFLQRLVNGGGRIDREYALGRGRMDLCIHWHGERFALEMKVWRAGRANPLVKGLAQLDGYLSQLGLATGWLVIFDQRASRELPAEDLGLEEMVTPLGRRVTVVRA
jgi:AAA-like domain